MEVGNTVKVTSISTKIHIHDDLIGLTGKIESMHDEYSHGSVICPWIAVQFGGTIGQYRFYKEELEVLAS